ncbi:AAA family ATPase [Gemmatimonadota bacterium Y43]|uniref:TrlF family AAA-like ATPase n=1 Tax=Gaopeijia maritima TaxID=3119007 RepID=UPI003291AAE5
MTDGWNWPGSRWWRVDLHTHTPASHDFGSLEDRDEPDWERWVAAARDAGLHAVAVTDHNTGSGIESIQAAAQEVDDSPTVFPGVELTASCGTHLLFILDPRCGKEHIDYLLSLAGVPVDGRGSKEARSPKSVSDILTLAHQNGAVCIGAHVNGPSGLLGLDGLQKREALRHEGLLAVEVDPERALDERWLDGTMPEVGRRLSRVWASDAHDFESLGRRYTWVKMTRPDQSGLRLALIDGPPSLTQTRTDGSDPNRHASLVIESIEVDRAKYMGRPTPLKVRFNPWLNTIIGGRGTGKSTLVDFLRKALRRDSELEDTSLEDAFASRLSVAGSRQGEGLLTDQTKIEVVYRKDGDRFAISWDGSGDAPPIRRLSGGTVTREDGDVRERFPVRIYNQKQLFELAQNPNALLKVIDDSESIRRQAFQRRLNESASRYLSTRAEARAASTRAADLPNRQATQEDVRRKLEILQSTGGAEALSRYRLRRQQDGTWRSILTEVEASLDELGECTEQLIVPDLLMESTQNASDAALEPLQRMHALLRQVVKDTKSLVEAGVTQAKAELSALRTGEDERGWQLTLATAEAEYDRVAKRLADSGIANPGEYRTLMDQAARLEAEVDALRADAARAEALEEEADTILKQYRHLAAERTKARQDFAGQASASQFLRVDVSAHDDRDRETMVTHLREVLGIDRFDGDYGRLADRLSSASHSDWAWSRLDQIVRELRGVSDGTTTRLTVQDGRFLAALARVNPEQIDRLALLLPADSVEVNFRDGRGSSAGWKRLSLGSPGQQTAALLAFVLGFGTEPIILDQPEDDLDSTLIYELLVQRLQETKATRQVIVVTHNANIVVHGNAEYVLSLDSKNGQTNVRCQGGLQEEAVRDEVCRVMEGGREAFMDRYRRVMATGGRP